MPEREQEVAGATAPTVELRGDGAATLPMPATAGPGGATEVRPDLANARERRLRRDGEPGARIGSYEIIRLLGRGGMGEVYVARDTKLGRRVAIKRVSHGDARFFERFLTEARATARCSHENIVVIHEVSEHDGMPFMVLEYLEGQTLFRLAGVAKKLSPDRAVDLITPVVRALVRAHAFGIVHRDLKPENVFVTEAGVVKVLDFGIAKAFESDEPERPLPVMSSPAISLRPLTQAGHTLGTPPYMAPEQVTGDRIDGRSDIWAVGVMLFELLTGQHPYGAELHPSLIATHAQELDRPVRPAIDLDPSLPSSLVSIVERCLAKRADDRYPTAEALLADLEAFALSQRALPSTEVDCPYPGLSAFQSDDASRFFGRSSDVHRAMSRLIDHPMLAVVGPSGAGKSSFVRAGVTPALGRSGRSWEHFALRPGRDALAGLARLVKRLAGGALTEAEIADRLRAEPGYLGTVLRERSRRTGAHMLLFVDQFEELFTLVPAIEDRLAFSACLLGAADDTASPVRVVLSVRADFVDRAAEDPALMARISRGLLFLAPLDRQALREALVRPAAMLGYEWESDELVDEMLDALEHQPAALPLLQFAAATLWHRRDQDRKLITAAAYAEIGGIGGALTAHADEVVGSLTKDGQRIARAMFQQLVTADRTRAILERDELIGSMGDPAAATAVVDQLVERRLLVVNADAETPTIEIVHESLIDGWPALTRWIDEERDELVYLDQLRGTARQWDERGRPDGMLWRDDALEDARRWRQRDPNRELGSRERAYLDAAFAQSNRARRRRRWLVSSAFVALAAIATGALVAMIWIGNAQRESRQQAERARDALQERVRAQAATLEQAARADAESKQRKLAQDREQAAAALAEQASAQVEVKDEHLREANQQLQLALAERERQARAAVAAKDSAEAEAERARKAEAEVRDKKSEVERLLAEQREQVRKLEQQLSKISTELK